MQTADELLTFWRFSNSTPKWLIRIVGWSAGNRSDYHGIGVRVNRNYLLAHDTSVKYADKYLPFNTTYHRNPPVVLDMATSKIERFPDTKFPNYHKKEALDERASWYYPELVTRLKENISLYRIKTRPFADQIPPVSVPFPLDKVDMPKLAPPGFKSKSNECYVLSWSWRTFLYYPFDPLVRVPVDLVNCSKGVCTFRSVGLCGGYKNENLCAPVLCSNGKEDIVAHLIFDHYLGVFEEWCATYIHTIELGVFLVELRNFTGYKRPGQTICPVC